MTQCSTEVGKKYPKNGLRTIRGIVFLSPRIQSYQQSIRNLNKEKWKHVYFQFNDIIIDHVIYCGWSNFTNSTYLITPPPLVFLSVFNREHQSHACCSTIFYYVMQNNLNSDTLYMLKNMWNNDALCFFSLLSNMKENRWFINACEKWRGITN